jgi:hypothetical protein
MTQRSWTRHLSVALLLITLLSLSPAATEAATARTRSSSICRIDWRRSTRHVRRLIRCVAEHHDVRVRKAVRIAFRESRFRPRAYNPTSCAKGIYQHLCRYWSERAKTFGFGDRSAFNARANIFVTMRMVRRYGWDPWGG